MAGEFARVSILRGAVGPPDPKKYWAEWHDSGGGARKTSKNLWVYETDTKRKHYSITTSAGAKIQPYFDVPVPSDPNLYHFVVQGEILSNGLVRVWVMESTARLLQQCFGSLQPEHISEAILETTSKSCAVSTDWKPNYEPTASELFVTKEAYTALSKTFEGVSDEHLMQLFLRQVQDK